METHTCYYLLFPYFFLPEFHMDINNLSPLSSTRNHIPSITSCIHYHDDYLK
uniref:Uncharacterized protein n=1 Tax=Octopus bimaculoides TaxID=37653 RepID=A0A0L8HCA9_OCTBM